MKERVEEYNEKSNRDIISPTKSQVKSAFISSISDWSKCVRESEELPERSIIVSSIISRVPSYLGGHFIRPLEKYKTRQDVKGNLWVEGSSTWSISTGDCPLQEKESSHELLAGLSTRTTIRLTCDAPFQDWPGVANIESPRQGNLIAVLVLAWSYIFSAQWIELQAPGSDAASMIYLNRSQTSASSDDEVDEPFLVDLGDACEDAIYWWAAILSIVHDWQASVEVSDKKYYSPWSVDFKDSRAFCFKPSLPLDNKDRPPPSTAIALKYLAELCARHDAYGQCIAALVVALLLPCRMGNSVELPKPQPHSSQITRHRSQSYITDAVYQHYIDLSRYMSLACYTRGTRALFHGAFYEPGILCNFYGPWLQGAFHLLGDVISSKQQCRLIHIICNRQPTLACLWLGASVMGLTNHFLRPIRAGMFAVDTLSAAWTGTVNSFIGPTSVIKSCQAATSISRADECRLLYIFGAESYKNVPVCPFAPFGFTDLSQADILVREHSQCNGNHFLQYKEWRWAHNDGGSSKSDPGPHHIKQILSQPTYSQVYHTTVKISEDMLIASERFSSTATRNIFHWLRPEGHAKAETHLFSHPWFDQFYEDTTEEEESDEGSDGDGTTCDNSSRFDRLQDWLDSTVPDRPPGIFMIRE